MADLVAQIQEVNTRLTMAMDGNKPSESPRFDFRGNIVSLGQQGPSGLVHPERRRNVERSKSVSSLTDTHSASTWIRRIRGGNGSDHPSQEGAAGGATGGATGAAAGGADRGAAGVAASGAASGAAAGAAGGNGDPPPDPKPSDHGNPDCRIS